MRCVWVCAAAAAILVLCPALGASAKRVEHYAENGWKLAIRHDAFTGRVRCSLRTRNARMVYQPGAIGFRLGQHASTLPAWYRIDDAAPARWQDDYPALIAAGVPMDGPGLDNPTAGMVWLPLSKVERADIVRIRVGAKGSGHRFRMRGLAPMLEAAHHLGCGSDASLAS